MPTYVYRCGKCEHQFETFQRITEDPIKQCPECKGKVNRLLFPPGIVFKGSGFHVNDYPSSKYPSGGSSKKEDSASEGKTTTSSKS